MVMGPKGQYGNADLAMLGHRPPNPVPWSAPKTLRFGMGPVHSVGAFGTLETGCSAINTTRVLLKWAGLSSKGDLLRT